MRRLLLLGLMVCFGVGDADAQRRPKDFGQMAQVFSTLRRLQAEELAKEMEIQIPPGVDSFFDAAEAGNWLAVSNRFQKLRAAPKGGARAEIRNGMWAPVLETLGIYEIVAQCGKDSKLPKLYYGPMLSSMPKGSIYFGGTDWGRFMVTTANATQQTPPLYCLTQNALADNTYVDYLRAVYGKDIWLPTKEDCAGAFKRYLAEVTSGKRPKNAQIRIDNGRVSITGALGVMEINGIICEMIVEHNKAKHEVFIQESYVIKWMYPFLEPHGLILKLNPVEKPLTEDMIHNDMAFWSTYKANLMANKEFVRNRYARAAFSKLRCATGGLYASRGKLLEAEKAFREAMTLYPPSPEANYRLAQEVYVAQKRFKDAREVIERFMKLPPHTDVKSRDKRANAFLETIKILERKEGE